MHCAIFASVLFYGNHYPKMSSFFVLLSSVRIRSNSSYFTFFGYLSSQDYTETFVTVTLWYIFVINS